ncbi:TRADD-N-associated membrane domain-containing protein [Nostoc sp.]|uniref:TRADD-N-associated membrane domain-containing protein n=1 Tax=Nostoc sp. TaxID=1180 RepID=UPI002FFC5671
MISNNIGKQRSNNTDIEVSKTDPTSSCEVTTKLYVRKERLRQAQWSFNVALMMSAMCGIFSLFGVGLSVSGNLPDGSITVVQGLLSSVPWLRLAKDANDRLDRLIAEEEQP